ncbi:MAG: pyridoxamine 5'-phosphate oxidase family protein [Fulvivirga sp.]
MNSYDINNRNKVKRVPQRGHYDARTVHDILDAGCMCHVGFVVDGQPFVIPTLYGRKGDVIHLHGASSSRMLKSLDKGIDVCVTVTHVDGLVLARSIFHHSMNYRSVVLFGKAKKVSEGNKIEALRIVSEQIIPGRWEEAREPSTKELKATTVLEIQIDQASAKIRQGPPSDDAADYELNIWAGVVPLNHIKDEPVPDEQNKAGVKIPKSVKDYLKL